MKLHPLRDCILAQRVPQTDKTAGGLVIPDNAREKALEALVIEVGAGKRLDSGVRQEVAIRAGDTILLGKYAGSEVKLDGLDYLIVHEDDVLAVLEKASA